MGVVWEKICAGSGGGGEAWAPHVRVAEAAPAAQKTWLKDNRRLDPSTNENDRVHRLQNGNLRLTGLRSSDEGVYKCEAVNSEGEASSEGTLSVLRESTLASYCSKLYTCMSSCAT